MPPTYNSITALWVKVKNFCCCFCLTQAKFATHTSLICNTESAVPCIEFASSSLSACSGWPTWIYVEVVLPRNAFTVSGCPRTLRRNAVRHLESMFNLIRCQSRSVIPNRLTKWPTSVPYYIIIKQKLKMQINRKKATNVQQRSSYWENSVHIIYVEWNSNIFSSFLKLNSDIDMSVTWGGKEFHVAGPPA